MITVADVEKLAALARLTLTDEEKQTFTTQFDAILGYVEQVNKLDISAAPEARLGKPHNVTRSDEARLTDEVTRAQLKANFPETDGEYLQVPKILSYDE